MGIVNNENVDPYMKETNLADCGYAVKKERYTLAIMT